MMIAGASIEPAAAAIMGATKDIPIKLVVSLASATVGVRSP